MFDEMKRQSISLDEKTHINVILSYAEEKQWKEALSVLQEMKNANFSPSMELVEKSFKWDSVVRCAEKKSLVRMFLLLFFIILMYE